MDRDTEIDLSFRIRLVDPEVPSGTEDSIEYEVVFWPDIKGSPDVGKKCVVTQKQIFSFKETEKQFTIRHGITLPDELKKKWREVVAFLFKTRLIKRDDAWIGLDRYQEKKSKEKQAELSNSPPAS